jgi:hypothetical protein
MGLNDTLFEGCFNLLDDIMATLKYHNDDEKKEMLYHPDVVELVALHLKLHEKSFILKSDTARLNNLNNVDWIERAVIFIKNFYEENYE